MTLALVVPTLAQRPRPKEGPALPRVGRLGRRSSLVLHGHDDGVLVGQLARVDEPALQLAQLLEKADVGRIVRVVALIEAAVEGFGEGRVWLAILVVVEFLTSQRNEEQIDLPE